MTSNRAGKGLFTKRSAAFPRDVLLGLLFWATLVSGAPLAASAEKVTLFQPPLVLLQGLVRSEHVDAASRLHVVIELEPRDPSLEPLALAIGNPADPAHHHWLGRAEFNERFGRAKAEVDNLARFLLAFGARNVYESDNRLIVAGDMTIFDVEKAFKTKYAQYTLGDRSAVAPTTPLSVPASAIRAIRGVVAVSTPRFADVPTDFRGDWFLPKRFRDFYDPADNLGAGKHAVVIADASDALRLSDLEAFLAGEGAPTAPGNASVSVRTLAQKGINQSCGRDDRGQEATMDVDAMLTMAPLLHVDLVYDDICVRGNEGTIALQRVLDEAASPDLIVFPFAVGSVSQPTQEVYGPTSIPYLEAAVRGIPIVVPSGDDGAYGTKIAGQARVGVTYPCVLAYVICVGGTELGTRGLGGPLDEAPWNDGDNASGGGISQDPRPPWQDAPSAFEFSLGYVKNRMVPDVSADASGHLRIFWHNYASGGVGGTSESAAIVGAQLAMIAAGVPAEKKIAGPGDLYALARARPDAFRSIIRENDRAYSDNTIRPRRLPLPINYSGVMPSPVPLLFGCASIQPKGCAVKPGYNAVTGIGSLRVRPAIDALKSP